MDIGAVRTALAVLLDTLTSVERVYSHWQDNLQAPCVVVLRGHTLYGTTFEDGSNARLVIRCLVPTMRAERTTVLLDEWASDSGAQSIPALIAANTTISGTVSAAEVIDSTGEGSLQLPDGGSRYLSTDITVSIWT